MSTELDPVVREAIIRKLSYQSYRTRILAGFSEADRIIRINVGNKIVNIQLSFTEVSELANQGRIMEFSRKGRGFS